MPDKCSTCINYDPTKGKEKCRAGVWSRQPLIFLATDEEIEMLINRDGFCEYWFEKD